jgi:trimeric autotransporter adhesin
MAGIFYWVIYPASGTDPANTQAGADFIIAGQDGAGTTATGSGTVDDTGQASPVDAATETSVAPGTPYKVAWAWKDGTNYATAPYVVIGSFTNASITLTGATAAAAASASTSTGAGALTITGASAAAAATAPSASAGASASITLTGATAAAAASALTGVGAASITATGAAASAAAAALAATGAAQIILPSSLAAAAAGNVSANASNFPTLSNPTVTAIFTTRVTPRVTVTI